MGQILLDNVDANVVSDEFKSAGGPAVIVIRGDNFDGGTVTLEMASISDAGNRFDLLDNGSFTADGQVKLDYLPVGSKIRSELAGAGGSASNIFVEVQQ